MLVAYHVLVIKIEKIDGLSRGPDWKMATKNNKIRSW